MPLEQKLDPVNPFARHDPWGSLQKPPLRLTPSPALAAALAPRRALRAPRPENSAVEPPARNARASSRPSQNILTGSALPPPKPPASPAKPVAPAADGATPPLGAETPRPQPKLRAAAPVSAVRNLHGSPDHRLIQIGATLAGFGLLSVAAVAFVVMIANWPKAPSAVPSRAAILTVSRPPAPAAEALEAPVSADHAPGARDAPTARATTARRSTAARRIRLAREAPLQAPPEAPPEALLVPTPPEPLAPAPIVATEPRPTPEPDFDPEAPMAKRRGDNP